MTITQVKENLTAMGHGSTLNKVRNIEALFERAANNVLAKVDPVDTQRTNTLGQLIHDDLNNYPLPSDYRKFIDLYPQDNRTSLDIGKRRYSEPFAARRAISNKEISIEGSEGSKFLRANWKSNPAKTLHTMDSLTSNGTWSVVGSATGLKLNTQYKVSGTGSIEFDLVASGDGIQNTTMTAVDLTTEDELADVIIPVYLGSVSNITSLTSIWGNNLTTAYWTGVAQTAQADGTAFRTGWNYIKSPWSTATETGTVDPATIDSFKLTVQTTGAISNIRVDNIIFSLGRVFDIKYYSKYLFKNTAGTWLSRPTSDDDVVVLDSDGINLFLYECVIEMAQQVEGEDSNFDIGFASKKLNGDLNALDPAARFGLYRLYRGEYPSESKKAVNTWTRGPRFRR